MIPTMVKHYGTGGALIPISSTHCLLPKTTSNARWISTLTANAFFVKKQRARQMNSTRNPMAEGLTPTTVKNRAPTQFIAVKGANAVVDVLIADTQTKATFN